MIRTTHAQVRSGNVSVNGYAIYVLYDGNLVPAYVGCTLSLTKRFKLHIREIELFEDRAIDFSVDIYKMEEVFELCRRSKWDQYRMTCRSEVVFEHCLRRVATSLEKPQPTDLDWFLDLNPDMEHRFPLPEKDGAHVAERLLYRQLTPYLNKVAPRASWHHLNYWLR